MEDSLIILAVVLYLIAWFCLGSKLSALKFPNGRQAILWSTKMFAGWFVSLFFLYHLAVIFILILTVAPLVVLAKGFFDSGSRVMLPSDVGSSRSLKRIAVMTAGFFWLHLVTFIGLVVTASRYRR